MREKQQDKCGSVGEVGKEKKNNIMHMGIGM